MKKMSKAEQRITLATALLVLLTGILVSIAATLPLYRSVRGQIEAVSLANAHARQVSLEHQLNGYRNIADQFSSRTEIRRQLQAWLNGEISLEALQAFTLPRLLEPAGRAGQLAAMFRISQGTTIAALGAEAGRLPLAALHPVETNFAFHLLEDGPQPLLLIQTSAPILDTHGAVLGHDILFFYPEKLLHHLQDFGSYGQQADVFLYQPDQELILGLLPENGEPRIAVRPEALQLLTDTPDLRQAGLHEKRNGQTTMFITQPFDHSSTLLVIRIGKHSFYTLAYHGLAGVHLLIFSLLLLAIIASREAIRPLISTLTRQTRQLEESQAELQLAASVFENTREAIAITDTSLHLVRANQAMQLLCKHNQDELSGTPLSQCLNIPGHENEPFFLLRQLCEQGRWQGEVTHSNTRTGVRRTSLLNVSTVHDKNGAPLYYIHIFSDITARTEAEQKVRHLAEHDALTGLLNRSSILLRIQETIEQQIPFSILFIDLDQFKPVNDLYGHHAGDTTLRLVTERLRHVTRTHDTLARLGGDEFLLMLATPSGKDFVTRIAADVLHQLMRPFDIDGTRLEIGASIGIAHYPEHGNTADAIIHAADLAMYCAKRSGGNRFSIANGHNDS